MKAISAPRELLFVSARSAEPATVTRRLGLDDAAVTVTSPDTARTELAERSVDCVVCGDSLDHEVCLDLLASVETDGLSVPVVVFTGEDDAAQEVLAAGAAEVVRSRVAETTPRVVRQRIERVLQTERLQRDRAATPSDGTPGRSRQLLTVLANVTEAVRDAETRDEVGEAVVEATAEGLGIPAAGVFLFDDERNLLEPGTVTEELRSFYGESLLFGPDAEDSEAWRAYVTSEPGIFEDVSGSDHVANPDTEARSTVVYPLGEHGVFVAASREVGAFDEWSRQLVELLATTTEAALDRIVDRTELAARDRQLEARDDQIEQLTRLNELIREIQQSLCQATSREEVERTVCERLAAESIVEFAWIGAARPDEDWVTPRTWSEGNGTYLDDVSLRLEADEPAIETAASGSPTVVANVADRLHDSEWARDAVDRGFQSVVAVPLTDGETTCGTLAVYSDRSDAFAKRERAVLTELGRTVAHAINVTEIRRGVLADRVTELELRVPGRETFLNAIAAATDSTVAYTEHAPTGDGRTEIQFGVETDSIERVFGVESAFVSVEAIERVQRGDTQLFTATVTGRTVAGTVLDCGAIPHEIRADSEGTTAVVRLPREMDVRVFITRLEETYPEVELRSRRKKTGRTDQQRAFDHVFESKLTDRQREVLTTAFESGFFQSPRETTGVELAERLDVSQPTVTHHLREGQRRLYETLIGNSVQSGDSRHESR